jgi:hypothetical protein
MTGRERPMSISRIIMVMGLASLSACETVDTSVIDPPPPGQGFQLTVPDFDVPLGTDTQRCYFFAVPGTPDQEVWVNKYEIAQPMGTHHMNLYRVKTIKNLSGKPGDPPVIDGECFNEANWSDWPLVVNSQKPDNTIWTLPDTVGARFQGGELLMLQTQFVNATTQHTIPPAHVRVNFWTTSPQPNELGTLLVTNQNIEVCPNDVNRMFTKTCQFPDSSPIHVVAANGHFHSRGARFEMFSLDAMGNLKPPDPSSATFYTSVVWNDPTMFRSDETHPSIAELDAGGGFRWNCYFNFPTTVDCATDENGAPTSDCCYQFGPRVEVNERCDAFVYYWPKVDTDVTCF